MTAVQPITVAVMPAPIATVGVDTDLEIELTNVGEVACRTVIVEFAVRRPLLLAHGDRRIELDRLGAGERHRHPIRLRATEAGAGVVVLRTFSYQNVLGRIVDAGGTTLPITISPSPPARAPAGPASRQQQTGRKSCREAVNAAPTVFVSHRSTDSVWFLHLVVDHLRRNLRPHPVFADTDLRGGEVWPNRLEAELRRCAALVALIGPHWTSGSAVLRHEIRTALERDVFLLPVLFDGARMPRHAELPSDMAGLADRQAIRIDSAHRPDDLMRVELELRTALTGRDRKAAQ